MSKLSFFEPPNCTVVTENELHNPLLLLPVLRHPLGHKVRTELAERMHMPHANVSRIENGQNVTFATFARYLRGCGFDWLGTLLRT